MSLAAWILLGIAGVLTVWSLLQWRRGGLGTAERIRLQTAAILVAVVLLIELTN